MGDILIFSVLLAIVSVPATKNMSAPSLYSPNVSTYVSIESNWINNYFIIQSTSKCGFNITH